MSKESNASEPTGPPKLAQLCSNIVELLSDIREGKSQDKSPDPPLVQRGDDGYLYLETRLSGHFALEADFTIHNGKAFIRICV